MDASIHAKVSIGGLRPVCVMHMFIRARAVDSRSLVMVAANYLLSLRNVHCHRSSSADVICDMLEIRMPELENNSWPSFQLHY